MKRDLLLLSYCCAFTYYDLLPASPSYIQTKDGVIVFTDPAVTGTSKAALFPSKEHFEFISSHTIKQIDWIWTLMSKRYYSQFKY